MNRLLLCDAYKTSHIRQYPKGTTLVYSNWTPRSDKYAAVKGGVVVFGIQAFFMKLNDWFNNDFFYKDEDTVVYQFEREYKEFFGVSTDSSHVRKLHKLGYIPISVKSLPEGSICPIGVPMLTIYNTLPEFYWITNFLETIMSTELWLPMTSATISRGYKLIGEEWADKTCDNKEHLPFQFHDFSMRGMSGLEAAMASGAGHLVSSNGTDTIPAVAYVNKYYPGDNGLIGTSIPATEHSVMSMGTKDDEIGTFRKLITETYPNGLISIVSDTWDLWKVLTEYIPTLKEEILTRDGKVVIRPDSGDPADIICGKKGKWSYPVRTGVIELLWNVFGGTINKQGYKVLDPHIGAIYGDSITIDRASDICERLAAKGFASSNIVFGVGSYTYQYNTRDTYGFAMKATYGEVEEEFFATPESVEIGKKIVGREIFKDPITDDGMKKSLKGLISVGYTSSEDHTPFAFDQQDWLTEDTGLLELIYEDSEFLKKVSFKEVRDKL